METMTKEYLLHYLESQARVNQMVVDEWRRQTYEERWRDLEMLFCSGLAMGLFEKMEEDEENVRSLWVRLKQTLGSKNHLGRKE